MKKFFSSTILIFGFLVLWHFILPIENYTEHIPQNIKNFASSTVPVLQNIKQEVFAPGPLKKTTSSPAVMLPSAQAQLGTKGIISWTNQNRRVNGNLPPLQENNLLDQTAQVKVADMFKQQYFEHQNPQGKGPADLAKAAGYSFISVGENLALGDFKDDQDLLTAWMNSPGHRANILNNKYTEMGAAVGQGMYQGQVVWLAVQEFGKPVSACPAVSQDLKNQMDSLNQDLKSRQVALKAMSEDLNNNQPSTEADFSAYNQKVQEYNDLVNSYNNEADKLKQISDLYNSEVGAYNLCAQSPVNP